VAWVRVSFVFQVMPCSSGPSPVSIEVCEGRVLLGEMVVAARVWLPSRIMRPMFRAPKRAIASGRRPSTETMTTCLVAVPTVRAAVSAVAVMATGDGTCSAVATPAHPEPRATSAAAESRERADVL